LSILLAAVERAAVNKQLEERAAQEAAVRGFFTE
jgi:hypothetical protein